MRDENHCQDCCCARIWKALGVSAFTGKSIVEHVEELVKAEADLATLRAGIAELIQKWQAEERAMAQVKPRDAYDAAAFSGHSSTLRKAQYELAALRDGRE